MRFLILLILLLSINSYAEQYDLSTPEKTLLSYYKCSETKDEKCVLSHIKGISSFQFNVASKVIDYEIKKKIIFTNKEVTEWNTEGFIPSAMLGDIQIDIQQTTLYDSSIKETGMYTYVLRKYNNKWKIYSWYNWGSP